VRERFSPNNEGIHGKRVDQQPGRAGEHQHGGAPITPANLRRKMPRSRP
jgi:hypothetical protein